MLLDWPMLNVRALGYLLGLLAELGFGVAFGRPLKFGLAARATQEVVHALILYDNMGLASIDAFAADRIF